MADDVKIDTEALSKYFMGEDLQNLLRDAFKREPTKMDFKVAAKAASMFITLPPSHGVTSVIKTLLGKAKQTKKQDGYGIVAGMKEYGQLRLKRLGDKMYWFLRNQGVMKEVDIPYNPSKPDEYCPDWIRKRVVCELEVMVLAGYMEMLGEQYGVDAPEPIKEETCNLSIKDAWSVLVKPHWTEILDGIDTFVQTEIKVPGFLRYNSGSHTKSKLKDGSVVFSMALPLADIGERIIHPNPNWFTHNVTRVRLILNASVDGKLTGWKVVFKELIKEDPAYPNHHPNEATDYECVKLNAAQIKDIKGIFSKYLDGVK